MQTRGFGFNILEIHFGCFKWRSKEFETEYKDVAGFCKSANIQDVHKNNYILTPGRYIDFKKADEDNGAFDDKMKHLTLALEEQLQKAVSLDNELIENLKKIGFEF